MNILSLEQLLEIHAFGEELYPTLADKAAAIIRGIVADHPFVDGDERTAMLAGLTLLAINGVQFAAAPGEIENFAVSVATNKLDIPPILAWLCEHTSV